MTMSGDFARMMMGWLRSQPSVWFADAGVFGWLIGVGGLLLSGLAAAECGAAAERRN